MNGIGNGPIAVLTFFFSFTVSGTAVIDLITRVLVMILVGLLGKGVDVLFKLYLERRRERRRARVLKAEDEAARLKGDAL